MKTSSIDDILNKLPEKLRQVLSVNMTLLENADFDSKENDVYMNYLSERIIFYDWYENDHKKLVIKAFIYNQESFDFFNNESKGLFSPVSDLFSQKNWDLECNIQVSEEPLKSNINQVKYVLNKYVNYLVSENVAKQAEKNIEDGLTIESILKKKNTYAQSNKLTKSGFNKTLTVVQKKLLNYLIFKSQYTSDDQTENGSKIINVSTSELKKMGCGSNQTTIKKSLVNLMKDTIMHIEHGNQWGIYNVFRYVKGENDYDSDIKVAFSPEMTALIDRIGVSRNYTLLSIGYINKIKRYTSMRLYELCCQYRNSDSSMVYLEDDTLRIMLNCTDKYLDPHNFKKAVLDVAQKELQSMVENGELDLYFTYHDVKKGESNVNYGSKRKKIEKWAFVIHKSKNYVDGFVKHEEKNIRNKNAYDEITKIFNDYLSINKIDSYLSAVKRFSDAQLSSFVQELRFEVYFNTSNSVEFSIDEIMKKYGFREGESIFN